MDPYRLGVPIAAGCEEKSEAAHRAYATRNKMPRVAWSPDQCSAIASGPAFRPTIETAHTPAAIPSAIKTVRTASA
jgi:hypothetical protein